MTRRDATSKRALFRTGIAVVLMLVAGCGDSHLLTGVYRSEGPIVLEDITGFQTGVHVELVLGHFGPDVAGIVRFCGDQDCVTPATGMCRCRFLLEGRVEGDTLLIGFPSPVPCEPSPGLLLGARLAINDDGDRLTGAFGRDLDGSKSFSFQRVRSAEDMSDKDRECEETLEEAALP